jgi:hypothetical protein
VFGAAMLAATAPAAPGRAGHPAARVRRDVLGAALSEPFNVVLLAALLVAGALLGTLPLMVPLALVVYAAGVVRSYRDPATAERVARSRHG